VRTGNQIRFLNINENECLNPNSEERPVEVEFYLINSNGESNLYLNEEFINLLENHRFDYKLNVRIIQVENNVIEFYYFKCISYFIEIFRVDIFILLIDCKG